MKSLSGQLGQGSCDVFFLAEAVDTRLWSLWSLFFRLQTSASDLVRQGSTWEKDDQDDADEEEEEEELETQYEKLFDVVFSGTTNISIGLLHLCNHHP